MPRARNADQNANTEAYRHPSHYSANKPTAESSTFAEAEDYLEPTPLSLTQQPTTPSKRYPTLNWKRATAVERVEEAAALYVHDRIHPEEYIKTFLKNPTSRQGELGFAALNGYTEPDGTPAKQPEMKPYQYQGHWTNQLIRSTAQRAMASLIENDQLRSQVNLVYMDPPYNISFRSNFQAAADDTETAENLSGIPQDAFTIQAFRDNYRDGIHSYLDGLNEQLTLTRELLADDGSIIIQIGPDNLHPVAMLMAEVFGHQNHVATIPYRTTRMVSTLLTEIGNWLIWYAKDKAKVNQKYHQIFLQRDTQEVIANRGGRVRVYENGDSRQLTKEEISNPKRTIDTYGKGNLFTNRALDSSHTSKSGRSETFHMHHNGQPCDKPSQEWLDHQCDSNCLRDNPECPYGKQCGPNCHASAVPCPTGRQWRVSLAGLHSIAAQGRLMLIESSPTFYVTEEEQTGSPLMAIWDDIGSVRDKHFIVETPAKVLERCILMTTDPGDLVLDLTCGSGAMPIQCETWGRRWISCDVSAVSIAIARERIATTTYPYHHLVDSPKGHKIDHDLEQELYPPDIRSDFATVAKPENEYRHDPKAGFVTERQVRVSAATLAYGPDMDKDIIRHPDRTRKDTSKRRTASPFVVCTDSPHEVYITPDEAQDDDTPSNIDPTQALQDTGFTLHMKETLQTTGIQRMTGDTKPTKYLVENLQPAPQRAITHTGEIIAPDGTRSKAAFYIGQQNEPIYGKTVMAAIRACHRMPNVSQLIMVGFEISPEAPPVAQDHDHPKTSFVHANRDVQLTNLKTKSTDTPFTFISEPDIKIHEEPNGQISVEVTGLNVFNPSSGKAEYSRADQIIGIMVDTDYDRAAFRARLMNVKRNKRNQNTLKYLRSTFGNNVDPEKWERMTSHRSLPFTKPEINPIAVKVIDRAGMEHMAIIEP